MGSIQWGTEDGSCKPGQITDERSIEPGGCLRPAS
jgi:hypothetical protein